MDAEPEAMDGHGLLLAFDTDHPEFARGFEAGRLWALLRLGENVEAEFVCAENAEMVLRLAEATGRPVVADLLDKSWMSVSFATADEVLEAEGL
jgi:hypothetical protein